MSTPTKTRRKLKAEVVKRIRNGEPPAGQSAKSARLEKLDAKFTAAVGNADGEKQKAETRTDYKGTRSEV